MKNVRRKKNTVDIDILEQMWHTLIKRGDSVVTKILR